MIYAYNGVEPKLGQNVFLAPGAIIVGDVELSDGVNVWFYSVIRGDVDYVRIGRNTNIQDHCMLHVTGGRFPLVVGNEVVVGHRAVLHGCTIHDGALVGIGALVLDGAVVEEGAIVAAGSVVTPGSTIRTNSMVAGTPAQHIRDVTDEDHAYQKQTCLNYRSYAEHFGDLVTPVY